MHIRNAMNTGPSRLAGLILAGFAGLSPAATLDWNASASFWELSTGWTPAGPPGAADVARFMAASTQTLSWGASTGDRSAGILHVLAGNYSFSNPTATLYTLALNNTDGTGFQVSGAGTSLALLGVHVNVTDLNGTVGSGALLQVGQGVGGVAGRLSLGSVLNVAGAMSVQGGSVVSSRSGSVQTTAADTNATATVSGAGSAWNLSAGLLVGGTHGSNTLSMLAGGAVNGVGAMVGRIPSHVGVVNVSGAGSQFNHAGDGVGEGDLVLGWRGTGTLNVGAGGQASNINAYLGDFASASGTANVSGAAAQWLNSGALTIGNNGQGMLTVDGGGRVTSTAGYVGRGLGSNGYAAVGGAGSHWQNSADLIVGEAGGGALSIQAGGKVSNLDGYLGKQAGAAGNASVSGDGAQWTNTGLLTVGDSGGGTLAIEAGAVVSNTVGNIAYLSGSTGSVQLSGAGSQWNNAGTLTVGYNGTASLSVMSGAQVGSAAGFLGYNPGSLATVTLDGAGSRWTQTGDLHAGYRSDATLTVSAGAQLSNAAGFVATFANADATATVSGTGSAWTSTGPLNVATYGQGELKVLAGGLVTSQGGSVAAESGSVGQATVSGTGSQWRAKGDFYLGGSAFSGNQGGTGTLTIAEGGAVNVDGAGYFWGKVDLDGGSLVVQGASRLYAGAEIHTEAGGAARFLGGLGGAGQLSGAGLVHVSGELRPGNSAGLLGFGGDLLLDGASVSRMELGGTVRGSEHDAVDVAGTLTLGGTLQVELLGGYVPVVGAYFDLFAAEQVAGSFAGSVYPALTAGLEWRLDLLNDVGGGSTDLLRLSAVQAASLPIPEPSTLLLWGCGLLAVLGRRFSRAACAPSPPPDRT